MAILRSETRLRPASSGECSWSGIEPARDGEVNRNAERDVERERDGERRGEVIGRVRVGQRHADGGGRGDEIGRASCRERV